MDIGSRAVLGPFEVAGRAKDGPVNASRLCQVTQNRHFERRCRAKGLNLGTILNLKSSKSMQKWMQQLMPTTYRKMMPQCIKRYGQTTF